MKLNYNISLSDILIGFLYVNSKSPAMRRSFLYSRFIIPSITFLAAVYSFMQPKGDIGAAFLFAITALWVVLYPAYHRRSFLGSMKTIILERFSYMLNTPQHLTITQDHILDYTDEVENKYFPGIFKDAMEFKEQFIIRLKTEALLIVPKASIEDMDQFRELTRGLGLKFRDLTNWKW